VVALGSNLGNREEHFLSAVTALRAKGVHLQRFSSVYETPPIGYMEQPDFLNMVAMGPTGLPPGDLLSIFQSLEKDEGREREVMNGPRPLDLDLIFFGDKIIRREKLRVPHPRWRERSFVVQPLAEIAGDFRDPETGWKVGEVAGLWPQVPRDIRAVQTGSGFQKALEEWK
jgi:2-amino-4-hydroxy-6-hydroxymethyldihydropteridine diphosphokinase